MKTAPATDVAVIDAILARAPAIPVIALERLDDAVPLARALVAGGLPVLEVTLRTPAALDAIRAIREWVPEALVGAGTVLDGRALAAVQAAGGAFAIAPGCTDALYEATRTCALPFLPAVATASELMRGLEHGYRRFKFFPAQAAGGTVALRAFAGPFPQARFCPTGGIDGLNASGYLALPNVASVGGSWMLPAEAIAARDWDRIESLAREAAALRTARG